MGKKAKFGVNTYVKRDRPRKRPGRHKKILTNTKKDSRKKEEKGIDIYP